MEIWGITGIIGSGKSTAVEYLREQDIDCLDADQVSRIVVDKDTPEGKEGFAQIYRSFGASVLNSQGQLDRGKLRQRMMSNPEDHKLLESILHPLIMEHIKTKLRGYKENGALIAFIEGSRLIESGFHNMLAGLIVVTTAEKKRVDRLMARDHMGKDEVRAMSMLQDEAMMKRIARKEWKNDGKKDALFDQIDSFIEERMKVVNPD